MNIFVEKISKEWFLLTILFLKISGVAFATLIFSKYSPLIDSDLYLKGFYANDAFFRTRLIHYIAVFLNDLGGIYFTHLVFALFSAAGLIYYCLTGGRHWIFLLFLLLPSQFIWTSIVGKEALYFGAFGLALVIWSRYVLNSLSGLDIIFLVFAVSICLMLRPHYSVSIFWLFISTMLIKHMQKNIAPILILIFIVGAISIYSLAWESLLLRGFGGIDPFARASRHDYFGIDATTPGGYHKFKSLVWIGAIYGVIGPFPTEVLARVEFSPFFVEGLLIFLAPIIISILVIRQFPELRSKFFKVFLWSLMPAMFILITIHAPFGLLNPGSATRWRANFDQIFYFAPLLLLFRLKDEEKKNITFSR